MPDNNSNTNTNNSVSGSSVGGCINYGEIVTTIGVIGGIYYGMKKKCDFKTTAIYAMALGIVGAFIGNAVNKYQTEGGGGGGA